MSQPDPTKLKGSEFALEATERWGYRGFFEHFWDKIDPGTEFVPNWHIDAMCDHLEACFRREIKRLVITIPPRHLKSQAGHSAFYPYVWSQDPSHKLITGSYDIELCRRDTRRGTKILTSEDYTTAWPTVALPQVYAIDNLENGAGGRKVNVSPESRAVGWGGQIHVYDDLLKPKDATSRLPRIMASRIEWIEKTMATRFDGSPEDFVRVLIMQRLHDADPAGYCLDQGWEHLCLPFRYTPLITWDRGSMLTREYPHLYADPRTEQGQLLHEGIWTEETAKKLEKEMGSKANVDAQLNQNPTPSEGGYVDAVDLEHTYEDAKLESGAMMRWFQIWDLGFKGRKENANSRVAGGLFAYDGEDLLLVDVSVDHLDYVGSLIRFCEQNAKPQWKRAKVIYVEDKANGPALKSYLTDPRTSRTLSQDTKNAAKKLHMYDPGQLSKEERLVLQLEHIKAGRLKLPKTPRAWLTDYKKELTSFNRGRFDDLVDITSEALNKAIPQGTHFELHDAVKGAKRLIAQRLFD